jgi:Oligoribonuclease (3''->5'' exoribonuclease)
MSEPLPLLWCDIETSGLNINSDVLLEVAVFTTDPTGVLVNNRHNWIIKPGLQGWDKLHANEFVTNMHKESGLYDDLQRSALELGLFEHEFKLYMKEVQKYYDSQQLTMAGSGVGPFDLPFLCRYFPWLKDVLTYYVIDVGVIGRFLRNVLGIPYADRPTVSHRAMDDINEHYAEFLQYAGDITEWRRLAQL